MRQRYVRDASEIRQRCVGGLHGKMRAEWRRWGEDDFGRKRTRDIERKSLLGRRRALLESTKCSQCEFNKETHLILHPTTRSYFLAKEPSTYISGP